jgi:hypothetical protein
MMNAYHPFWEIGIGTTLVLLVVFVHGFAMFSIQNAFDHWFPHLVLRPHRVLSKVLIGGVILSLLAVHYVEILMWATTMYVVDALPDMRSAFYYAGGAYTTYGSGNLYLPENWRLLGFMIATSGLFTFAWTTGILISVMNRFLRAGEGGKRLPDEGTR